ncbi:hypothetical protein RRG08_058533 [Elysia crispata]|uniref:Uncharacterized protein n=1 Tax=Elysia crispata TaxID=231223 RepID=A0AAE1AGU8_9GAST|nr:hypothetical protein RRG08_058533 [Elysia crispata]
MIVLNCSREAQSKNISNGSIICKSGDHVAAVLRTARLENVMSRLYDAEPLPSISSFSTFLRGIYLSSDLENILGLS